MDIVIPNPLLENEIAFDNDDIYIIIGGEDWEVCHELSKRKRSFDNKPKTPYRNGLANTADDPHGVGRIGYLGEFAFSKLLNYFTGQSYPVDISLKKRGDDFDFCINEYTIDVKTSMTNCNKCLIRCRTDKGFYVKPKCDYYVSACRYRSDLDIGEAIIVINGYQTLDHIVSLPEVLAFAGHKNYELLHNRLLKTTDLLKFLGIE